MTKILTGILVRIPCPKDEVVRQHHLPDPERQPGLVVCVGCPVGKE